MSTESSTQQRPWAAVAPWPVDDDPVKARAHYAAMAWAYHHAILAAGASREALDRYTRPSMAAFAAAGLIGTAEEGAWDITEIGDALAGGEITEVLHEWLAAAGINPDEIAPAS